MSPLTTVGERDDTIIAVERASAILNLLQVSTHELSLKAICHATGLNKATASRYMHTLCHAGYAEQDVSTKQFRVGPSLIRMWPHFLKLLRERARPHIEAVRDELDETVSFGVLESDAVVLVDIVECNQWLRIAATPGMRLPLHSSGLGKAIAAHLPRERVHTILAQAGMPRMTKNTITTIDAYMNELDKVRDLGYALDEQEHDQHILCVAAPILGAHPPAAAISVSAPAGRLSKRDIARIGKRLRDIAGQIAGEPLPA